MNTIWHEEQKHDTNTVNNLAWLDCPPYTNS